MVTDLTQRLLGSATQQPAEQGLQAAPPEGDEGAEAAQVRQALNHSKPEPAHALVE